jgi:hypothetical protein
VNGKEGKLSKLLSWLKVFFSSSKVLGNVSSFDNSERLDNVVELEEYFPKESHWLNVEKRYDF